MSFKTVTRRIDPRRATRLSTGTFAAVTQLLPVGVGIVNEQGRFVSLNDAGLAIYGLDSVDDGPDDLEQYREMFPMQTLDGRLLGYEERPVARALRGEAVVNAEVLMRRHSDQEERLLSISASLLPEREEKLAVFVIHDITERMQATRELISAHGLIQSITHGTEDLIAAEDKAFNYVFYNEAYEQEFRKLWGVELETGTNMLDALAPWPEELARAKALWSRALDGESFSVTADFGQSAEDRQVYDLRFNPIHDADGKLTGAAHILRNVTERVRIQDALERSEEALRESDRRKDEFLATLAHELRNPLAPIRSGIELLRHDDSESPTLDMMERQMDHLVRLVDDLLDVSRISRGKISLETGPVDVREAAMSAWEAIDARYDQQERSVRIDLPADMPRVNGDFVRTVQMIGNLISNAFKFTEADGRITITGSVENGFVRLAVKDDGAGIEPDKIGRVFELFNQGDAVQGSGLGIGLTLVKQLAELHGGRVTAQSAGLRQGAEFTIYLPACEAHGPDTVSTPAAEVRPRLAGIRVLVVDDNEDAALALTALLESLGADVKAVFDGMTALSVVGDFAPDAVLLDIGLPDIDGDEVARLLRDEYPADKLQLIAVTGWNRNERDNRNGRSPFNEHLVKPVSIRAVSRAILAARGEQESEREGG